VRKRSWKLTFNWKIILRIFPVSSVLWRRSAPKEKENRKTCRILRQRQSFSLTRLASDRGERWKREIHEFLFNFEGGGSEELETLSIYCQKMVKFGRRFGESVEIRHNPSRFVVRSHRNLHWFEVWLVESLDATRREGLVELGSLQVDAASLQAISSCNSNLEVPQPTFQWIPRSSLANSTPNLPYVH
jgi:hypothetical protein